MFDRETDPNDPKLLRAVEIYDFLKDNLSLDVRVDYQTGEVDIKLRLSDPRKPNEVGESISHERFSCDEVVRLGNR